MKVSFRLNDEQKRRLEEICADEKMTYSQFFRRCLDEYSKNYSAFLRRTYALPDEEVMEFDDEENSNASLPVMPMPEPIPELIPEPTPELSIPEPEPEPLIIPPPVPISSPVYTTPPEIKALELDVTGMSPIDIVKYSLVAIHRVDLEFSPVKMQELQYAEYLRYGYEDYCMVKYRDNYSGSAPLRFNVDIYHTFDSVWGDATHAHNVNIRSMMFIYRQYIEACKKIKNFKMEMLAKVDRYDKAFGAEFDKVDNPVTRFFKNRENIFLPSVSRDRMLEIFLDVEEYKKYYKKLVDGIYE